MSLQRTSRTRERTLFVLCQRVALGAGGVLALACTSSAPEHAPDSDASRASASVPRPPAQPEPVRTPDPLAGAPGVGDAYFPELGNGGYDVQHYDVVLHVEPVGGRIDATATIDALATQDLTSFHLDLWGLEVRSVQVDGDEASFSRAGRELAITPLLALERDQRFRTVVRYDGVPELAPDASVAGMGLSGVGWWKLDSGIYTLSECAGAASWLPSNDHPLDKATFSFAVTVPEPWSVAANGLLEGVDREGAERTYRWRASDPMATYLATVNVTQLELEESTGPGGLPLRLYHPSDSTEQELEVHRRTGEMIEHFSTLFGPYPFEAFGALITPEELGGALETQTMPIYSRGMGEGTVAHELAHQWFGNCVSLTQWRDMWLNEGFASYGEWLWREHTRGPEALEHRAARAYRYLRGRSVGPPIDPGVEALFSGRTYLRGAFVLHMLRLELGDELFFGLLRRWVAEHHDGNASTGDFVALAEEVGGRELDDLFQSYLYDPVIAETARYEEELPEEERGPVPGRGER